MVDSTKSLSQQTIVRAGTTSNPLGLYNYESYEATVSWNMNGWLTPINGIIRVVKVNDICTFTINEFTNTNSGAIMGSVISSGSYRLPKRFLPKLTSPATEIYLVCLVNQTTPQNGLLRIYNNPANVLDANNGLIQIGIPIDFTNLNGRPLTSAISYKTNSMLNE